MAVVYERKLEIKYLVVSQICNAKHILFAETSEYVTKNHKMQKWQEIFHFSVTIGGLIATRDWSYLRDVYWPNIKRSTMTKIHRQTALSKIDLLVLEILNLKMEVVKGNKTKGEIHIYKKVQHEAKNRPGPTFDDSVPYIDIKEESVSLTNSPAPFTSELETENDLNENIHKFNEEHLSPNNFGPTIMAPPNHENPTAKYREFKKNNLTLNTPLPVHRPSSSASLSPRSSSLSPTPNTLKDEMAMLRKRKLEEQVEYLRLQNVKARLEIKEAEIRVLMLQKDLELKNFQTAEK